MASKYDSVKHLQSNTFELLNSELNLKVLKPLDEVLRCRICFDYFNNCMITKCSHNYCSVCIRRYMMYKAQCPTCFQDASEPELRNNRLIDEVLRIYRNIKEMLQCAIQHESKQPTKHSKLVVEPVNVEIKKDILKSNKNIEKHRDAEKVDVDSEEVSCPVCYIPVLKDRINIHLDSCLKLKEKESYPERKTLSKLVYHLLSDKEIRKRLREHGLNASGDRKTLIRRHKNFLTLYNANCDSLNPKPVRDLVVEIEAQELEERLNTLPKQSQVNKKSDISDIEREQESYAKEHQSQFTALIQDIHQRHIGQIVLKQEVQDDCSEISGSQHSHNNLIYDVRSVNDGSHVSPEENIASDASTQSSTRLTQETCLDHTVDGKTKTASEENDNEMDFIKNIKQEPPPYREEERPLFKNMEKIQDSFKNESSSNDYETGKITQLNLLRKRKKGKVKLENRHSLKKK